MLIPIGDHPNPDRFAVMNTLIIGVNVAVFLLVTIPLMLSPVDPSAPDLLEYVVTIARERGISTSEVIHRISAWDLFVFRHGFRSGAPEVLDALTSMFMHAGFLHLFGNMLILWIFGDNVEDRMGPVAYALAYLGSGVIALLTHYAIVPGLDLPLVGASGAISGVLGLYWVWFPRNQVKILFWFYWALDIFYVPARLLLGFYLLVENLVPLLVSPGAGPIAHGAHIGGFLAGLLLAYLLDGDDPGS